jgi:bacillolysin/neutral peptidase B
MPRGFVHIRFDAADLKDAELRGAGFRSAAPRGVGKRVDEALPSFNNDETAARHYLGRVFERDSREPVRGLAAPDRAALTPDFRLIDSKVEPLTNTRLVRFEQTQDAIPIFGSKVVVHLDGERDLVQVGGEVAEVQGLSPMATLSPGDALGQIASFAGVPPTVLAEVAPPVLTIFHDDEGNAWHLAYLFTRVPAAPPEFSEGSLSPQVRGHGLGPSPRRRQPHLNYLVDAHDGSILFYFSANPTLDIPVKCQGTDALGIPEDFFCNQVPPNSYEMVDPLRSVKTFDMNGADITTPPPGTPIVNQTPGWGTARPEAVSAHVNAGRVFDFYSGVLKRDGIDDKGMDLNSIVNCTYKADEPPPQWHNAVWWNNAMWYGQARDAGGKLQSFSRFLDIIAHELTHGVTETTSNLVYKNQSGALNESFSDIFGIIIRNWFEVGADSDVSKWKWELGPGLGTNGLPLRDLSDPTRTGDPAHMDSYVVTTDDSGGVHTNSNIHNKAAYNVLNARDTNGPIFTAREVALLYYVALTRLSSLAGFKDTLNELLAVASIYYVGKPTEAATKKKAIEQAYAAVGIK